MLALRKRVNDMALAYIAITLVAVIGLRRSLFDFGAIQRSFEWYIPPLPEQLVQAFLVSARPWDMHNFGLPNLYPTMMFTNALAVPLAPLGGAVIQRLFLLSAFVLAPAIYFRFLRSLKFSWLPSISAALAYALNPFVLNHMAAGHTPYVMGLIAIPLFFNALLEIQKRGWASPWVAAVAILPFGLQLQSVVALFAVCLSLAIVCFRRAAVFAFIGFSALVYLCANAFWLIPLVAQRSAEVAALRFSYSTNVEVNLLAGSRSIMDAIRLEPYSNPITLNYLNHLPVGSIALTIATYIFVLFPFAGLLAIDRLSVVQRKLFSLSLVGLAISFILLKGAVGIGGRSLIHAYQALNALSFYKEIYHYGFFAVVFFPIALSASFDAFLHLSQKTKSPHIAHNSLRIFAVVGVLAWGAPFLLSGDLMGWARPHPVLASDAALMSIKPDINHRIFIAPNAGNLHDVTGADTHVDGVDSFLIYTPMPTFGNWLTLNGLGASIDNAMDEGADPRTQYAYLRFASISKLYLRGAPVSMFAKDSYTNVAASVKNLSRAGLVRYDGMLPSQAFQFALAQNDVLVPVRPSLWKVDDRNAVVSSAQENTAAVIADRCKTIEVNLPPVAAKAALFVFRYASDSPASIDVVSSTGHEDLRYALEPGPSRFVAIRIPAVRPVTVLFRPSVSDTMNARIQMPHLYGFPSMNTKVVTPFNGSYSIVKGDRPWLIRPSNRLLGASRGIQVGNENLWFGAIGLPGSFEYKTAPAGVVYSLNDPLPLVYAASHVVITSDPLVAIPALPSSSFALVRPEDANDVMPVADFALFQNSDRIGPLLLGCSECRIIEPGLLVNEAYEPSRAWVSGNRSSNWVGYYDEFPGPFSDSFLYTTSGKSITLKLPHASEMNRIYARVWTGTGASNVFRLRLRGSSWHSISTSEIRSWVYLGASASPVVELSGTGSRIIDSIAEIPLSRTTRKPELPLTWYSFRRRPIHTNACNVDTSSLQGHTLNLESSDLLKSQIAWTAERGARASHDAAYLRAPSSDVYVPAPRFIPGCRYVVHWRYNVNSAATVVSSIQIADSAVDHPVSDAQVTRGGVVEGSLSFRFVKYHPEAVFMLAEESGHGLKVSIQSLSAVVRSTGRLAAEITSNRISKVSSSPAHIDITMHKPGEYLLHVHAHAPFVLVVNENFDPLWTITAVDGSPLSATHFLVNAFANGWLVKKTGDYELKITYGRASVRKRGLIASSIGLSICLLIWFFLRLRTKQRVNNEN